MASQKLYAGAKLRELRTRLGLTQKVFAAKLGISLPYLNQMENNNRPISTTVVLALAQEFGFDVAELTQNDAERLVAGMREAMADPIFVDTAAPVADLRMAASNVPALARAFIELHRAYRQTHDRLASLDEALGREDAKLRLSPWEEVRDFFHHCDNYLDAVDRAAEHFAESLPTRTERAGALEDRLRDFDIVVRRAHGVPLRRFDEAAREVTLSALAPLETQSFQLLVQIALLQQATLLEATLDLAQLRSPEARQIAKLGLANYFAGAAMMPYTAFLEAARETRHDLELLAARFGASIEQVAHRLSTLQRPGAKGVPFFFVRVDQAGTITKRHSATRLQFARYSGACPLWNVHRAFEMPGQFLRQLAETPDRVRYISLAREISKTGGHFGAPRQRYAIAIGCEVRHATELVYADDLDVTRDSAFEPIGISCRICERTRCPQRSVPPLERQIAIDPMIRETLPYALK